MLLQRLFFIDDELLCEEGITDFSPYAVKADAILEPDLFLVQRTPSFINAA